MSEQSTYKEREYQRILAWRQDNAEKISDYNRQYYLRKKNGFIKAKHEGIAACKCGGKLVLPKKVENGYMMTCKLCGRSVVIND